MDHTEVTRTGVPFRMSLATSKLIEAMKNGKPGDMLTDEELERICGLACHSRQKGGEPGKGYGYVGTAIRYCVREHRVVWKRVPRAACIKCLKPDEIRTVAKARRRHICKVGKWGVRELATVEIDRLSDSERREHLLCTAQLGALAGMADNTMTKKLEARNVTQAPDMQRLLEAMKTS